MTLRGILTDQELARLCSDDNVAAFCPKIRSIMIAFDTDESGNVADNRGIPHGRFNPSVAARPDMPSPYIQISEAFPGLITYDCIAQVTRHYINNKNVVYLMPMHGVHTDTVKITANPETMCLYMAPLDSCTSQEKRNTLSLFMIGLRKSQLFFRNVPVKSPASFRSWFKANWKPPAATNDGLRRFLEQYNEIIDAGNYTNKSNTMKCEKCRLPVYALTRIELPDKFQCTACIQGVWSCIPMVPKLPYDDEQDCPQQGPNFVYLFPNKT